MTLFADIGSDYQDFDNVESLTYTPQGTGAVSVTGVQALRRVVTTMMVAMLGSLGVDVRTVVFHLFASTLNGNTPQNGDKLTDSAGLSYTILSADKVSLGTRFKVLANPQAVNQP